MDQQQHMNRYLKEQDVAEITGLSLSKLRNDRSLGVGLPYYKIGRSVRYKMQDLDEFMDKFRVITIDA